VPNITIVFGALLTVLGIGGYLGSTSHSITALIPAAVGVIMILCGIAARKESNRKHAMHGAATVALIGFLAAVGRLAMVARSGTFKPTSGVPTLLLAILTAVFVVMCVRSFVQARRHREAQAGA
jgi:hypothetical protein